MNDRHGELFRQYCLPERRYQKLLSTSFTTSPGRMEFAESLMRDAKSIPGEDLDALLAGDWREQLVAFWLIGYGEKRAYARSVHDRLASGMLRHIGKGVFFTLARFGRLEDGAALRVFLREELQPTSKDSYQPWALGALLFIEKQLYGHDLSSELIEPNGVWDEWSSKRILESKSPDYWRNEVEGWVELADRAGR